MYNRYTPQPDGSFHRKPIPEDPPKAPPPPPPPPPPPEPCPPVPPPEPPQVHPSCGDFLKNLLPGNFDTGDLLVVLLLILIAGDNQNCRSSALLTLALYFLM